MPAEIGRPEYQPTEEDRNRVHRMSSCGFSQEKIAQRLDIDPKTLRRHFRKELDHALIDRNLEMAEKIYQCGLEGEGWALCFWMKANAGWRDTVDHRIVDSAGNDRDLNLQTVVIQALAAHPDARQAVAQRLLELEAQNADDEEIAGEVKALLPKGESNGHG